MTVVYLLFSILSLFACMLPAGVFSVIWEPISENLTVGVPYIAILRMLLAAGAVVSAVLSDRIRRYPLFRDIVIGSTALEALTLVGFSLSRVFWNLCLWSFCLGVGIGMEVCLLCRVIRCFGNRKAAVPFAGGALGAAAGVWILSQVFAQGGGWRTACQILAVAQVLLCLLQFSMRHRCSADPEAVYGKNRIQADSVRLICCYPACALCSVLIFGAILWPQTCLAVSGGGTIDPAVSVMIVCSGLACGRLLYRILPGAERVRCLLFVVFCAAALMIAYFRMRSGISVFGLELLQFSVGVGAGPVMPWLIASRDERFDPDSQDSLFGLLPAFYFGSWAVITPLTQALVGSSQESGFSLWLLAADAVMAVCLVFGGKRVKG